MEIAKLITSLPATLSSLIILISAAVPLAGAAADHPLTDDSKCGCFLTNGTSASYFSHHDFYDFRDQGQYARVPPVITSTADTSAADATSDYFKASGWTDRWMLGGWNNSGDAGRSDATVLMINSPNNIYIEKNTDPAAPASQTWLTLRTQRLAGFQTAAEIESVSAGYHFLSMRMLARTVGASGAITAMFTYRGAPALADVQEADLEVRTLDHPRNLVHYTNQPSYTEDGGTVDKATKNATMPYGMDWTSWAVHRFDWTPTTSTWYVDGHVVANISVQTPRDSSKVILNAWSDGGAWAGNMTEQEAAYLQIQWFELVYNSTDPKLRAEGQGNCTSVCSVDETSKQGQPVLLWGNGALSRADGLGSWMVWIPSVLVMGLMLVTS
ncbi:concanavalin A-like lectin/glucanase domain-containing protein [Bombardia bombarda]|uniref:Concanavalin A-like lectin/glucanase domain-containing protein n=1 Tax=Bombardia bombarda TaxID=252184 RepID=A0AA40C0V8_9PEZI|nr:concanavalin A-like lectin/glucanase domain-containing protein [Bombardia bombarda]